MNDQFIGNIISIIVVIGLVVYALIISLYYKQKKANIGNATKSFKILENNKNNNDNSNNQNVKGNAENLMDNKELVAVITAAIYASMGEGLRVPKDGLIVRSIRRVNARR